MSRYYEPSLRRPHQLAHHSGNMREPLRYRLEDVPRRCPKCGGMVAKSNYVEDCMACLVCGESWHLLTTAAEGGRR